MSKLNVEAEKIMVERFGKDNGHNNFEDENTIILKLELTDGVLMSHGIRYEF